jgi:hypothetical protein
MDVCLSGPPGAECGLISQVDKDSAPQVFISDADKRFDFCLH